MTRVSDHVALALAPHLTHVFGVMGNGNAYFIDAVDRTPELIFTPTRHEAGGVVAADSHYRVGGGMAGATTTFGAGFTNTLTALADAVQSRTPLVLVVGEAPTTGRRLWDVAQEDLATGVGARTFTVGRTGVTSTVAEAVGHALAHRVPVVIAIPNDLVAADAGEAEIMPVPAPEPAPLPPAADIAALARMLAEARRPLLLAGRGAWLAGASTALGRVADLTGAVTATTALGRNLFPRAEFDLGVTGGFATEGTVATIHEADVAVVFGAALNQFTLRFGETFAPGTRVYQIDLAEGATHPRVDAFLRGDAREVADALGAELERLGAAPSGWRERCDIAPTRIRETGEEFAGDGRLDPRPVAVRIAEILDGDPSTADRAVVTDGGHFMGWANMYWPIAAPDRIAMAGVAYQSIGLGFPAVPGAARALPGSAIVLSTGDGGGLMAIADLESAARVARGRGLAVVWNDAAYTAEVSLYGEAKGLSQEAMRIPEVDFATMARAVGARGVVVRTLADLEQLRAWTGEDPETRPFLLLDCRISASIIAPYYEEVIRVNTQRSS